MHSVFIEPLATAAPVCRLPRGSAGFIADYAADYAADSAADFAAATAHRCGVIAASNRRRRTAGLLATLIVATVGASAWLLPMSAHASPELARAKNCIACHAPERKLIGPAYKDIAKRYRDDKDAVARLSQKIREGGGGAWGVVRMPANPQVNESESLALTRWILGQP